MGCGKSKHAVATSTTIVKSVKSDGGKETHTTTTVTEKETVTTTIDPPNKPVVTTAPAPTLTSPQTNSGSAPVVNVNDDANSPTSSKDIVGVTEVTKEDQESISKEDNTKDDEEKTKLNLADAKTEDVEEASELVKEHAEVEDSNEEQVESEENNVKMMEESSNLDEKSVDEKSVDVDGDEKSVDGDEENVDGSLNPKEDEEQKDVVAAEAGELTKLETKKEDDVKVNGIAGPSSALAPGMADKATVAGTNEKQP